MAQRTADVKWWWYLACNQRRDWRESLGMGLRNIADMIDGRETIALRIRSNPATTRKTRESIIRKGIEHMQVLLCEISRLEAIEPAYKEVRPELFDENRS